ncbi:MAG: hypothetical protein WCS37_22305, partial [Chloroflexota bacterium]
MSEETKRASLVQPKERSLKNILPYLLLGGTFVIVLILVTIAMLLVTGHEVAETKAPTSLEGLAAEGKALYLQLGCSSCHPSEGRAGGFGPR